MSALRQEIQDYIDIMPDNKLEALKPLLIMLSADEESFIIETDLTDEEREIIAQGRDRYARDPGSFVSLDSVK